NWSHEVAVLSRKCGGYKLKINDADHHPPHCHVNIGGRNTRVDLVTLKVLNPPPHRLPPQLVRCIRKHQEEMLEAWDRVVILA
ncbi:MAG: DUF4160 domain-containing protein, partial [Gemmatimonadota bacterium]